MTTTETTQARPIGASELRGLLGQIERRRGDGVRLLLVSAEPRWDGPEVIESAIGQVRVVPGPSPLAIRIAMVDHPNEFLAILTPLAAGEIGEEVLARAWRRRPMRPSPWDAVTSLFRVQQIDPSLRPHKWMLDLLVQLAPSTGYPQPTSQVLDRETAWRTLYRYGLRLPKVELVTADLLRWAASPDAANAVGRLDEDARRNVAAQLAIDIGPAAEPVLELVAPETAADVVALGLVLDALWPAPDPVARALLQERHLRRRPITDEAASDWGSAARAIVGSLEPADRHAVLQRAETILDEVDGEGTADSSVLESGFRRRLSRCGTALRLALEGRSLAALDDAGAALREVCSHESAASNQSRIRSIEAAFRLVRRQLRAHPEPTDADLAEVTTAYLIEGSWVDAARLRLAEGETLPELVTIYQQLAGVIDDERRHRDRTFARAVAAEGTAEPPAASLDSVRPLRIEQILDTVVRPVAEQHPVLFLVVDGLSHAAAVPMFDDFVAAGWRPHGPLGRDVPGVVAALPTVTVCSRASLLAGRLTAGGQDVERDGFHNHTGLTEAAAGQRPRLFHKSDLRVSGSEIAPEPRQLIADATQRIVGVVVNGVDDFLAAGGQVRLADGLDGVPLLRQLLDAALEAGRVVVITSDHGHILGSNQRVIAPNGGGERYRLVAGDAPAEDEILLKGPRVLRGDGSIVAAADDGVRYIGVAKHGYHGGATPAEVLCPLFVFAGAETEIDGWQQITRRVPSWWDPHAARAELSVEVSDADAAVVMRPAPARAEPQLSLLEPEDSVESASPSEASAGRPGWLDDLLGSPRLASQRELAGRVTLDDDELAKLLRVLVASGGTASGITLQRILDVPATRLRGKLEAARSLLDVEGYPVLRIEADGTAVLNADLLAQQFEIDRPNLQGNV